MDSQFQGWKLVAIGGSGGMGRDTTMKIVDDLGRRRRRDGGPELSGGFDDRRR